MSAEFINFILVIVVFGGIYFIVNKYWKMSAQRVAVNWCASNDIEFICDEPIEFFMGRPARIKFLGAQSGVRYVYLLKLSTGPLVFPDSLVKPWSKVALEGRVPV